MNKNYHPEVKKFFQHLGKLRAQALSPKRRSEIARMGGIASMKARLKKKRTNGTAGK